MNEEEPDLRESLEAAARSPVYTGSELVDRLYDMVLRLTQELAVTREEVGVLRRILTEAGLDTPETRGSILSSEDFRGEQLEAHKALVARVVGDLPSH